MAGQKVPAETALTWGLLNRISERDGLIKDARALAEDALGAETSHIAGIKGLLP